MSVPSRARFNPDKPFPEGGIVTPPVFPSPVHPRYGRLDLHDILEGRMPKVRRGQTPRQGWLKIALGNGPDLDYSSPHLSEGERHARAGKTRKSLEVNVDVEEARIIKRVATTLNVAAFEVPSFDGQTFGFMEDDPEAMKSVPVEQAIAFSGIAGIRDTEVMVTGIHFDSCQEKGWILLGDTTEPLDQVA